MMIMGGLYITKHTSIHAQGTDPGGRGAGEQAVKSRIGPKRGFGPG